MHGRSRMTFVNTTGETVSGFIIIELPNEDDDGSIEVLGVAESARGEGLGRGLLSKAVSYNCGRCKIKIPVRPCRYDPWTLPPCGFAFGALRAQAFV